MTGLKEILERGLPEAPGLDGLAGRAERGARRRRSRRRSALAAGAVVVVVGLVASVVAGPSLTTDDRLGVSTPPTSAPTQADEPIQPTPSAVADARACVPSAEAVPVRGGDLPPPPGVAESVRFCGTGVPGSALVPDTALVGVPDELLATIRRPIADYDCLTGDSGRAPYRAQIAYSDGSVEEVTDVNAGCGSGYEALMLAIAEQSSTGPAPTTSIPSCPSLRDRRAGQSRARMGARLDGSALLTRRASTGVVCRYDTGEVAATPLEQPDQAESLRIALLGHAYEPNTITRCGYPADRDVVVVLTLDDASTHRVLIEPCGETTVGSSYLGLARRALSLPS